MKQKPFIIVLFLLLIIVLASSCGRSKTGDNRQSISNSNNIIILSSSINAEIRNQQQFKNVEVKTTDNSLIEFTYSTLIDLVDDSQYISINDNNFELSCDKSISKNYITQEIAQYILDFNPNIPKKITKKEKQQKRRDRNNRRESDEENENNDQGLTRYMMSEGDIVEINNIIFEGIKISGIVAEVNSNINTDMVISESTLQKIVSQIEVREKREK